jgi:DNA-directed RNA polymerase III subunit RPC3
LKPSTILSHLSPRDKALQYEAEEKRKITGFPTAKELREVKEIAQARLKREEEEAEKVGLVSTVTSQPTLQIFILLQKRKAIDQQGPRSNKVNYLVINHSKPKPISTFTAKSNWK